MSSSKNFIDTLGIYPTTPVDVVTWKETLYRKRPKLIKAIQQAAGRKLDPESGIVFRFFKSDGTVSLVNLPLKVDDDGYGHDRCYSVTYDHEGFTNQTVVKGFEYTTFRHVVGRLLDSLLVERFDVKIMTPLEFDEDAFPHIYKREWIVDQEVSNSFTINIPASMVKTHKYEIDETENGIHRPEMWGNIIRDSRERFKKYLNTMGLLQEDTCMVLKLSSRYQVGNYREHTLIKLEFEAEDYEWNNNDDDLCHVYRYLDDDESRDTVVLNSEWRGPYSWEETIFTELSDLRFGNGYIGYCSKYGPFDKWLVSYPSKENPHRTFRFDINLKYTRVEHLANLKALFFLDHNDVSTFRMAGSVLDTIRLYLRWAQRDTWRVHPDTVSNGHSISALDNKYKRLQVELVNHLKEMEVDVAAIKNALKPKGYTRRGSGSKSSSGSKSKSSSKSTSISKPVETKEMKQRADVWRNINKNTTSYLEKALIYFGL
jgi:hypothetical protein